MNSSLKDNGYFISLLYNADMAEKYGIDVDKYQYRNFRDLEELFREVRPSAMPIIPNGPIAPSWGCKPPVSVLLCLETFLNDSYLACAT